MNAVTAAVRANRVPWMGLLIISAVFFYTVHSVNYTKYFSERGTSGYIVTEEEAQQIMGAFEKGQAGKALAYFILACTGVALMALGGGRRVYIRDLFSGSVFFFLGWAFMSVIWADSRPSTLNKLIILALLIVAIIGILKRFSNRDLLLLTFYAMSAYVAIGVLSEIAMGSFQPWVAGYRFSGTCHPNGQALDCGFLLFSSAVLYKIDRKKIYLLVSLAAFALLVLTKSRTSLACVIMAPLTLWALGAPKDKKVAFASLAIAGVCFVMIMSDAIMPALEKGAMMGRTDTNVSHATTLTGRTDLWKDVFNAYISKRPLLGYGYNSFWTVDHVEEVSDAIGFIPGNAHSAFIDIFLGLGVFGFISYLLLNAGALVRVVRRYQYTRDPLYSFFAILLLFSIFHSLTESTFLFPSFSTFICMIIVARLAFQDPVTESEHTTEAPANKTAEIA